MTPNHPDSHDEHGRDFVTIEMDGKPFQIHRGNQPVSGIKAACKVLDTWVIELIQPDNTLRLLANEEHLVIKGGERFISHVAGGGSS